MQIWFYLSRVEIKEIHRTLKLYSNSKTNRLILIWQTQVKVLFKWLVRVFAEAKGQNVTVSECVSKQYFNKACFVSITTLILNICELEHKGV